MSKTFTPFGNLALIEIIKEHATIVRNDSGEQAKQGVLRSYCLLADHLTESGGYRISEESMMDYMAKLDEMVGKTVNYQEHADSGRKIEIDGKQYVTVPWYRITGVWDDAMEEEAQ